MKGAMKEAMKGAILQKGAMKGAMKGSEKSSDGGLEPICPSGDLDRKTGQRGRIADPESNLGRGGVRAGG